MEHRGWEPGKGEALPDDLGIQARQLVERAWSREKPLALLAAAWTLRMVWQEIFFIGPDLWVPTIEFSRNVALFACEGFVFAVAALLARYLTKPVVNGRTVCLCAAALTAASLGVLAAKAWGTAATAAYYAASVAGAVELAGTALLWFALCAHVAPFAAMGCYAVAGVLGPLLMALCHLLPAQCLVVVGLALPWALGACLLRGPRTPLQTGGSPATERPSTLWGAALLMGVFGFAFSMRETLIGNGLFSSGSLSAQGSLLVCALLVPIAAVPRARTALVPIFRVGMPLVSVAFLILPTVPALLPVSDLCASASYTLVEAYAVLAIVACGAHGERSALRAVALVFGAHCLGIALGRCALALAETSGLPGTSEMLFTVTASIALALMVVLLPGKRTFKEWGLSNVPAAADEARPTTTDDALDLSQEERFLFSLHAFATAYDLTAREEEILSCLVRGYDVARIEAELVIGRETVRTHRRNLYAKCGVHSLGELLELYEDRAGKTSVSSDDRR